MTDSIVVRQATAGDPDAWTRLVEKHTPMVMGLAVRYTRNGQDAQDVVQETFLQCYARLAQLRDPARFAGWLRRIALNVCHMRQACRTIGEFEMSGITPGLPRQTPEIKLTFAIDTAGQFSCRARELCQITC